MERRTCALRWEWLSLLLVTSALSIMGCGGGSSKPASTATTPLKSTEASNSSSAKSTASSKQAPSPSGPIAQADAICAQLGLKLDAADRAVKTFRLPGLALLTALDVTLEQAALAELGKLKPVVHSREWQQSLADRRALVKVLIQLNRYATRNEAQKYKETYNVNFHKVQEQMLEVTKRGGFEGCSRVG